MNGHPDMSINHHNGHHHTSMCWDTMEMAEAVAAAGWWLKTGMSRALKGIFSCLFFFFDSTNKHLDSYTPLQHKVSNNYTPPFGPTCPDLNLANSVTDHHTTIYVASCTSSMDSIDSDNDIRRPNGLGLSAMSNQLLPPSPFLYKALGIQVRTIRGFMLRALLTFYSLLIKPESNQNQEVLLSHSQMTLSSNLNLYRRLCHLFHHHQSLPACQKMLQCMYYPTSQEVP